jgi:probable rRNA maturation factor
MIIQVNNSQKIFRVSKSQVKLLVESILFFAKEPCDEISINFVSSSRISKMHAELFDDPSPTDCITLLIDEDPETHYRVLGEVYVCPEVAIQYATLRQLNVYEEVTLYILHGILHLIGYNDIEKEERSKMRRAERRYMKHIKQLNLHLSPCS